MQHTPLLCYSRSSCLICEHMVTLCVCVCVHWHIVVLRTGWWCWEVRSTEQKGPGSVMREGTELIHTRGGIRSRALSTLSTDRLSSMHALHQGTDQDTATEAKSYFYGVFLFPFLQFLVTASSNNQDINCIFLKTNLTELNPKRIRLAKSCMLNKWTWLWMRLIFQ